MRGDRRCGGRWSKYPDPAPAEGPGVGGGKEGSERWGRPPSSNEDTEDAIDGAGGLPLVMEAGVEGRVSSDRKLALRMAGLGMGGPDLEMG